MKLLLCLISVVLMAAQPVRAAHSPRTLAFLGDSLTAGYGVETQQSYPSIIEGRLKSAGLNWKVINAGISGDTTAGGLRRLDLLLSQGVDVLFVCLGANDGMRGIPAQEAERNLDAIVDKAKAKGAVVVLAGLQIPENYGAAYRKDFAAIFPRIAKAKKIPFMPFLLEGVAMNPELNQSDLIHPNAAGHRIVAENVWKTLKPILVRR